MAVSGTKQRQIQRLLVEQYTLVKEAMKRIDLINGQVLFVVDGEGRLIGALKKLYSREFQGQLETVTNPHGEGDAAKTIKRVLKTVELVKILKKPFYDLSSKAIL